MAAFHELLPTGYDLVPSAATERDAATLARYLAEHPGFARLYAAYNAMPEADRDQAVELLERLFTGRVAET